MLRLHQTGHCSFHCSSYRFSLLSALHVPLISAFCSRRPRFLNCSSRGLQLVPGARRGCRCCLLCSLGHYRHVSGKPSLGRSLHSLCRWVTYHIEKQQHALNQGLSCSEPSSALMVSFTCSQDKHIGDLLHCTLGSDCRYAHHFAD